MHRLIKHGLMFGNLFHVDSPALVDRYNRALEHLTGKRTTQTDFHVDISGYSPEVGDELGGHIVSGHVDGVAEIVEMHVEGDSTRVTFKVPSELAKFIAPKGSVAMNGTSLTVNEVEGDTFGVNLISHTKDVTNWGAAKVGDRINLEIDTLARYVARLAEYS